MVKGAGFGHGVGMSQYGAYGYAKHGFGYEAILTHYYTGTTIGRTPEPDGPGSAPAVRAQRQLQGGGVRLRQAAQSTQDLLARRKGGGVTLRNEEAAG